MEKASDRLRNWFESSTDKLVNLIQEAENTNLLVGVLTDRLTKKTHLTNENRGGRNWSPVCKSGSNFILPYRSIPGKVMR